MSEISLEVLRRHSLLITGARIDILSLFTTKNNGLTSAEIEKCIGRHIDRVTIYRNLQLFVKKGILYSVPTTDSTAVYALCNTSGQRDLRDHAHFVCESCGRSYCLKDIGLPAIPLPKDFTLTRKDLVLRGKCSACKETGHSTGRKAGAT